MVWEAHVRDITTSEFWNGIREGKHKFPGVVESGTSHEGQPTGLDHIIDLGVNTVQILPMYDFSSVDELNPNSRNWGYDPYIYNTPEGGYSTDPDDPSARIREMKEMIQGFHDRGIKVVMDVVYNHTHNVGPQGSTYDAMVPKYYYRLRGRRQLRQRLRRGQRGGQREGHGPPLHRAELPLLGRGIPHRRLPLRFDGSDRHRDHEPHHRAGEGHQSPRHHLR